MSTKKTDKTLQKCDELIERLGQLKKALGDVTNVSSNRKPVNALGAGWSQDPGTGAFHHSMHGIISTHKNPQGGFEIRHGGGVVGRVGDLGQAGAMIRNYVTANLAPTSTGMHNRPSPNLPGPSKMGKPPMAKSSPAKPYTPEQLAAIEEARNLRKTVEGAPWMRHGSVPNADAEVQKLQRTNPAIPGEDAMATQLAHMMQSRAMMRPDHRQPSSEDMIMAGEAMGLAPSEEQIAKSEQQWSGGITSWLQEAVKPISQRFSSEEEELAYWSSIKVNGSRGDDYGF